MRNVAEEAVTVVAQVAYLTQAAKAMETVGEMKGKGAANAGPTATQGGAQVLHQID